MNKTRRRGEEVCSLLFNIVHIRRGSFASVQRRRPRRVQGDSSQEPNSSGTPGKGQCASRAQLQRKPYGKRVLAVLLKQKLPMQARTLSHFSREGGCGKVQCLLDSVASLESKMARRKTSQTSCGALAMSNTQAVSKQLDEDLLHPTTHTCLGVS